MSDDIGWLLFAAICAVVIIVLIVCVTAYHIATQIFDLFEAAGIAFGPFTSDDGKPRFTGAELVSPHRRKPTFGASPPALNPATERPTLIGTPSWGDGRPKRMPSSESCPIRSWPSCWGGTGRRSSNGG